LEYPNRTVLKHKDPVPIDDNKPKLAQLSTEEKKLEQQEQQQHQQKQQQQGSDVTPLSRALVGINSSIDIERISSYRK